MKKSAGGKRLRESVGFIPHFPSCLGKQSGHAAGPSIIVIACEENVWSSGSMLSLKPSFFRSLSSYWVKGCNSPVLVAVVSPRENRTYTRANCEMFPFAFLRSVLMALSRFLRVHIWCQWCWRLKWAAVNGHHYHSLCVYIVSENWICTLSPGTDHLCAHIHIESVTRGHHS